MSTSDSETTKDLLGRVKHRCQKPGMIVLFGVGNGSGHGNTGWSDAIAMQTWPSKGIAITGFEVKSHRGDWLKELDRPEKNAEWQAACHEWYIVAPAGIVMPEELPAAWGLLVPAGKKSLRITSRCEREIEIGTMAQVPLALLGAVFRAAGQDREQYLRDTKRDMRAEIRTGFQDKIRDANEERREAEHKYRELSGALGGSWNHLEELKAKASALAILEGNTLAQRLGSQAGLLERAAAGMRKLETELKPKEEAKT